MALKSLPLLQDYAGRRLDDAALDAEERAIIENFLLDERPPPAGAALYAGYVGNEPLADLDDWRNRHGNYTVEQITLRREAPGQPWTFRPDNAANRLSQIKPELYLLRVEDAAWVCSVAGITTEALRQYIQDFHGGDPARKNRAKEALQGVADKWNAERDRRPLYATTELEVDDIVGGDAPDWAERLRDQLGLGHLSPNPDRPVVEVLLMRYTVQEVLDSLDGEGHPAIPSVLDGDMNAYFFPIAAPEAAENPYYGHTVNLGAAAENDYRMGVELLHPSIDYQPGHFHKLGVIARPFTADLSQARRFHLPWIRLNSGRDDFGNLLEPAR